MGSKTFLQDIELQEVDDADDTVYEYGLPSEEEGGFIDSAPDLYAS